MYFKENEKTVVFIDGSNLYSIQEVLGWRINYKKFRDYFDDVTNLVRINYYTPTLPTNTTNTVKPLLDYLAYNGYNLCTKLSKTTTNDDGVQQIKGNVDIEMAVGMFRLASSIDHAVVITGDGDFRAAVELVQYLGNKVTVISSTTEGKKMCADELRRQADNYIDFEDKWFKKTIMMND